MNSRLCGFTDVNGRTIVELILHRAENPRTVSKLRRYTVLTLLIKAHTLSFYIAFRMYVCITHILKVQFMGIIGVRPTLAIHIVDFLCILYVLLS